MKPTGPAKKSNRLTNWIMAALVLGIVVGFLCHQLAPDAATAQLIAGYLSIITDVFLRLIKMIIAPLVFATLVGGIAHMGTPAQLGRIVAKTMGWFISASLFSLLLGLVMVEHAAARRQSRRHAARRGAVDAICRPAG